MFKLKNPLNKQDKTPFPDFTSDNYREIADLSEFIEDKYVSDNVRLSLACLGYNGIFLFFISNKTSEEKDEVLKDIEEFKRENNLYLRHIYAFIRFTDKDFFINERELVDIEALGDDLDMIDRFSILYDNTLRPAIDLNYIGFADDKEMLFVPEIPEAYKDDKGNVIATETDNPIVYKPFTEDKLEEYLKKLDSLPANKVKDSDEYIDENGVKYKKRAVKTKWFGYAYKDSWYPVANDDPMIFFLITLFGGWFGLHKYKAGEIGQGILYTLTCGGFGIFYLFDIFSICMGNYSVTQVEYSDENGQISKNKVRIYLDSLPKKWYRFAGLLAAGLIAFSSYKFVYMNALEYVSTTISEKVKDGVTDYTETTIGGIFYE